MISMGNWLPSLRRAISSIPVPICCASGVGRAPGTVGDDPFPQKTLGNDVFYLLPQEFIAVVSKLFLRLDIQQHNLAAFVHNHHWRPGAAFQKAGARYFAAGLQLALADVSIRAGPAQ